VYADSVGARIIEMPVRHHPRKFGKSKYGLERTLKVLLDLVTVKFLSSYANKPIHLFGGAGSILIAASFTLLLYLFVRRVFAGISVMESPLFQLSTMVFIMGFQSILMGLIAELLVRTYHESQGKRTYITRKVIKAIKEKSNRGRVDWEENIGKQTCRDRTTAAAGKGFRRTNLALCRILPRLDHAWVPGPRNQSGHPLWRVVG